MADVTYSLHLVRERENDGPVYLRKGSEESMEVFTLAQAVSRFGVAQVREIFEREIKAALDMKQPPQAP